MYNYKVRWTNRGYKTPLVDKWVFLLISKYHVFNLFFFRLIFKKVAKLMGGRVRLVMSGGAPLSSDTHEQIKICLCVEVIQGYGLTETTSAATVMDGKWTFSKEIFRKLTWFQLLAKDMQYGRVGAPLTVTDIKLVNWEEGNYRVTNKPHPQVRLLFSYYFGSFLLSRNLFSDIRLKYLFLLT